MWITFAVAFVTGVACLLVGYRLGYWVGNMDGGDDAVHAPWPWSTPRDLR